MRYLDLRRNLYLLLLYFLYCLEILGSINNDSCLVEMRLLMTIKRKRYNGEGDSCWYIGAGKRFMGPISALLCILYELQSVWRKGRIFCSSSPYIYGQS